MTRRLILASIVLGLLAFLGNGLSISYKFSTDLYAWLLGYIPAGACIVLLTIVSKNALNKTFLFVATLGLLGFTSLITHLIFCEIMMLDIAYLEQGLAIVYQCCCYLLTAATTVMYFTKLRKL